MLANPPARIALGSTRAYVTMSVGRQLAVLDVASRTVTAVISNVGSGPGAVAVSGDDATVYVVDSADGGLERGHDG